MKREYTPLSTDQLMYSSCFFPQGEISVQEPHIRSPPELLLSFPLSQNHPRYRGNIPNKIQCIQTFFFPIWMSFITFFITWVSETYSSSVLCIMIMSQPIWNYHWICCTFSSCSVKLSGFPFSLWWPPVFLIVSFFSPDYWSQLAMWPTQFAEDSVSLRK